jgi:hypothetical protein
MIQLQDGLTRQKSEACEPEALRLQMAPAKGWACLGFSGIVLCGCQSAWLELIAGSAFGWLHCKLQHLPST